nr:YfhJ family protein [Salirhabdus sp. Marseille-P4669]
MFTELTKELLNKNSELKEEEARTWIELLWEDFETTRAKAGREYLGSERTESIVRQWINNYGPRLHEVALDQEKWKSRINRGPIN